MARRIFKHALDFYKKKLGVIVFFSIPFVAAFLISLLVTTPSYLAAGSIFIRTGSMPELTLFDIILTTVSYAVSIFIISHVLTNLNLLIKEKRTKTRTKREIMQSIQKYTIKIFALLVVLKLLTVVLQLATFGNSFQEVIYPILWGIAAIAFFYVPPAIVIDEKDTIEALKTSVRLVLKQPVLVAGWVILGSILISIIYLIFFYIVGPLVGSYLTMLFNSLFLLPFLIILQSQMYMERYPLAK